MRPRYGCVVLTQGKRPGDLARALGSLLGQRGVELDVAVVGNGWSPTGLPDGVRAVHVPVDEGIPAGRNAGVPAVAGELLFFLDDDAEIVADDALAVLAGDFAADPSLGAVQLRVRARDGGRALPEWVPRLGAGGPERTGDVTALWEGAVAMRRSVFEQVGGWPAAFRFVHEGVDLAWRVLDAGFRVVYRGDVEVLHPAPPPAGRRVRHGYSVYFGARNRVWLARRHLPLPLGFLFVVTFVLRSVPRFRTRAEWRQALRGYRDGLRGPCGERRVLSARTLWRMTMAGRPPVI